MTWLTKPNSALVIHISCAIFMISLIIFSEMKSPKQIQYETRNPSIVIEPPLEREKIQVRQRIHLSDRLSVTSLRYIIENVPHIKQYPELINGCEVTSVAMLLRFLGNPVSKLELAKRVKKDTTPLKVDATGRILSWGNPEKGFVGDITGKHLGYAVYHQPIVHLINEVYPKRAKNVTGLDFSTILQEVQNNRPVIVWTTSDFQPTKQWLEWKTADNRTIRVTFKQHAVLLVGFDVDSVYINDPMGKEGYKKVAKEPFIKSWEQLGKQAVTVF
ncbi:C39 family peptidase [Brevibacillus sp. H7]|uniref:C39 family peptidase n=1 Tax=Brevibacillus sp. H7 TaxID=3349138 RepID=UPI003820CF98